MAGFAIIFVSRKSFSGWQAFLGPRCHATFQYIDFGKPVFFQDFRCRSRIFAFMVNQEDRLFLERFLKLSKLVFQAHERHGYSIQQMSRLIFFPGTDIKYGGLPLVDEGRCFRIVHFGGRTDIGPNQRTDTIGYDTNKKNVVSDEIHGINLSKVKD